MSDEFTISEGPARYQLEEVFGINHLSLDRMDLEGLYRDYKIHGDRDSISIGFDMYGDREKHERPHLCPKFDISNMEKIVKSSGIIGLDTEHHPSSSGEAAFLMEVDWDEYPGHEEFAYDLEKIEETVRDVDEYLQETEKAGNRIADELARE